MLSLSRVSITRQTFHRLQTTTTTTTTPLPRRTLQRHHPSPFPSPSSAAASLSSSSSIRTLSTVNTGNTTTTTQQTSSAISTRTAAGLSLLCLSLGYTAGRLTTPPTHHHPDQPKRTLPNGHPRACCSCDSPSPPSSSPHPLTSTLSDIIGPSNVLTAPSARRPHLTGARIPKSPSSSSLDTNLAVITPETLSDTIECIRAVVNAGCVIVPQGRNTGLTGGSVPQPAYGSSSASHHQNEQPPPRHSVVLSTQKLNTHFPIDNGKRVLCLAGTGISTLSQNLSLWGFPNRTAHSTLGSTFLNPTTAAGVAFGSGGTQLRKGPAYTDRALYVRVKRDKWGENIIEIVNTLGIDGLEEEDLKGGSGTVLEYLDNYARDVKEGYTRAMAETSLEGEGRRREASDGGYRERVCRVEGEGGGCCARFNADTRGEDCNRSEGKVFILATVHDTFEAARAERTFLVSFGSFELAGRFRREVCLDNPVDLPISVEYMDRDSIDVIDRSGRVLANVIKTVGMMSPVVGWLWGIKLWIESSGLVSDLLCDELLHAVNGFFPEILPNRMMGNLRGMDHHVAMTVGDFGDGEMERVVQRMDDFCRKYGENENGVKIHECETKGEVDSLTAFRFVAAPAFRTWCVGENVQGISVDYALPVNSEDAPRLGHSTDTSSDSNDTEPSSLSSSSSSIQPIKRMRYSHFGCNVVHEDLAYPLGVDVEKEKYALKHQVEKVCGGRLPAEHGHGTEYQAPKETKERWMRMDPLNVLNPGIGGLSVNPQYRE